MTIITDLWPDVHNPMHDKLAVAAALGHTRKNPPDRIVLLGDFLEMHALSTHRQDPRWQDNLAKEIESGRKGLEEIRKAAPKAEITYIEGNHEQRFRTYVQGRAPAMRLIGISLPELLGLDKMGIRWHDKHLKGVRVPVGRGQVAYAYHGHFQDRVPNNISRAQFLARKFGHNVITGHSHKLSQRFVRAGRKEVYGVEAGCLVNMKHKVFDYAGIMPEWTHCILRADSSATDSPLPRPVFLP